MRSSRQQAKYLYRLLYDGGCSEKDFVYSLSYWKDDIQKEAYTTGVKACIGVIMNLKKYVPPSEWGTSLPAFKEAIAACQRLLEEQDEQA